MLRESLQNFLPRRQSLDRLTYKGQADILVIGGGIHGASFAHQAALNGFDTILLERDDYAQGTSSRSSKMAHGGLRYLEQFDLRQVFEGVKAREKLFKSANHICSPQKFLMPLQKDKKWQKFKVGLGLKLYDFFLTSPDRRHAWVDSEDPEFNPLGSRREQFDGGYVYYDGFVQDARLVLDTILAARQEGALCLNHVEVTEVKPQKGHRLLVKWIDKITDRSSEIEVGAVVNCAGAWVSDIGTNRSLRSLRSRVRFSQGSHILFSKPWKGTSLILPLKEPGRYYFVWPYHGGTLVGTTEREILLPQKDPVPSQDEINEIFARLEQDLPDSGLNRDSAYYCYAGIRVLPTEKKAFGVATSQISRRHRWFFHQGVLSLIGGKLTTAHRTTEEGLAIVRKLAEIEEKVVRAIERPLPGAGDLNTALSQFRSQCAKLNIDEKLVETSISRLGLKVNTFICPDGDASWLQPIGTICLRGELEFALRAEQAETLGDIMERRLSLESRPGYGIEALSEILALFKEHRPDADIEAQETAFLAKINTIKSLLGVKNS